MGVLKNFLESGDWCKLFHMVCHLCGLNQHVATPSLLSSRKKVKTSESANSPAPACTMNLCGNLPMERLQITLVEVRSGKVGCPTWIRTMNNASKGRCVTITPSDKRPQNSFPLLPAQRKFPVRGCEKFACRTMMVRYYLN